MNKYEEALSSITFTMHLRVKPKYLGRCEDENLDILEELVEKSIPKKPIKLHDGRRSKCPNCESQLPFKKNAIKKHMPRLYCDRCGQRIDWSEDDE